MWLRIAHAVRVREAVVVIRIPYVVVPTPHYFTADCFPVPCCRVAVTFRNPAVQEMSLFFSETWAHVAGHRT